MASDTPRDAPWVMRTYSGHSSARASNELYRTNLAKGQTGLSIAFDLPTQTGYDPDAPEAAGEVGKVGVPVAHLGHMRELLDGIPVAEMNTSMTINATAAWLLGLYVAHAQDTGVDPARLAGTTQNDIVKEYLSRGTHIFPPAPSLRLTVDTIAYTVRHAPKWNPINVCSYHLQEAGATPVQEIAYALATAIGVLDGVRHSGKVDESELPAVVGRISFFVNSSVRFVEETCKMRAFTQLWDGICRERYGVEDPKLRRFRYGVQVNSLGLTEQQPENNVQRIVLETLGVTLSKGARARAMQLPAWNEALGLPRPWDQQWSLRIQQVLAFESDLLEYDDIFDGSTVIEAKTSELAEAATAELDDVQGLGGAFGAIDELKRRLVRSQADRLRRIESGEQKVVGVNSFTETAPSPLVGDGGIENILRVDHRVESEMIADVTVTTSPRSACAPGSSPSAPAGRRACWWPSPGSTATPTVPSRSRWRRATPASRWSTRASGSPRRRSWLPRSTRTSTSSASPSSRGRTSSWCRTCSTASARPAAPPPWWSEGSSRPTMPRCCSAKAWPPSTPRRTIPSTASWRIWWRWPNANAPPRASQTRHLTPADGDRAQFDGAQAEALGHVVVVQHLGPPVPLVAPGRDTERRRHGVQLPGVVRQHVGPAVVAVAHGGALAPVVDVDGQRRAQGRSRRSGTGLFHQRPEKRQASCTGLFWSAWAGRGQASCTAAVMAARTSGLGSGGGRRVRLPRSIGAAAPSAAARRRGVTVGRCRACGGAAPHAWRRGCPGPG